MKVKRHVVHEKYEEKIESMYSEWHKCTLSLWVYNKVWLYSEYRMVDHFVGATSHYFCD